MEVFLTVLAVVLIALMSVICFFQMAINAILKAFMDFFGIKDED